VAADYLASYTGDEGILFIGKAQELDFIHLLDRSERCVRIKIWTDYLRSLSHGKVRFTQERVPPRRASNMNIPESKRSHL
jgi:hypothetical protein